MIRGWKKLTKKERKHLSDNGIWCIEVLQRTINRQAQMREESGIEPCWDCRFIAKKLGIESMADRNSNFARLVASYIQNES